MKTIVISAPYQRPPIAASRSTVNNGAVRMKWHPARFLAGLVAKMWEAFVARVPVGYEDDTGFHYGVADDPHPVNRRRRRLDRASGNT